MTDLLTIVVVLWIGSGVIFWGKRLPAPYRVRLDKYGLAVGQGGINSGGLFLFGCMALVALLTDDDWWLPLVFLGLIPVVVLYSWLLQRAGLESVPAQIRPINSESDEAKRIQAEFDAYVVGLQHQIDAAGGVPADIPLTARLDCLIKQRDEVVNTPTRSGFGHISAEELGR